MEKPIDYASLKEALQKIQQEKEKQIKPIQEEICLLQNQNCPDKKRILLLRQQMEEIIRSLHKQYGLSQNGSGYYFDLMSKEAFLAYEKGEKPWHEWNRQSLLSCSQEETDFNLWLLRLCVLALSSSHHMTQAYQYEAFYKPKKNILLSNEIQEVVVKIRDSRRRKNRKKSGLLLGGWLFMKDERPICLPKPSVRILYARSITNVQEIKDLRLSDLYNELQRKIHLNEKEAQAENLL
jgi:hypothetical protein